MLVAFVGVVGLLVGSFLNVVVYRVPAGLSIVSPPSSCPSCGARIRPVDNVPVLSWFRLRGRCHNCSARISARYPLVELTTGLMFALVAWWAGDVWQMVAFCYLAAIAVSLFLIDLDTHRLPDVIVVPSYLVAGALLTAASWSTGDWSALLRAAISMAVLFVVYFVMLVAYPAGMGFGDVKLAGVLGLYLGWTGWGALVVGGFSAFLLGGVFAIGLVILRRAGRKSGIPFGPWMLLGAGVGVAAGNGLWGAYLSFVL